MIGGQITAQDGFPVVNGTKLSPSKYTPPKEVLELFAKCQKDYQSAWALQHRPFEEFDGISLLERAQRDQRTFAAYVGAEYIAKQKQWRWKGRKNTARNKLIGLLAHLISGMLYPMAHAQNLEDEEDKETAKVMRILVEEQLRKAGYQMKFLYMVLSALVNPAVFVEVDYLVGFQRIKEQLASGKFQVIEAIDTLLTGLALNIIPIDQLLLGDFYIGDIQRQPYLIRIERISWDQARKIYSHHPDFKFVEAGKTRVFMTGQEAGMLFDVDWTEADQNAVQVATFLYRDEDLEVPFVGGVFLGNTENIYNTNPFKHRRMSLIGDEWKTIPIYKIAKSGLEPIDPTGRFAYFKSGAYKEYWDDASQNKMHQLFHDGTYLDVIKPILGTGIIKADSTVIAPGAFITTPNPQATLSPWSLGPNLAAAMQLMDKQEKDISDSTLTPIMQGQLGVRQTAYAVNAAMTNAKIMLGMTSFMIADLIRQVGELTVDCVIQHTVTGQIDAMVPESLAIKYKAILAKSKDKGRDITNKVIFTDALMGKKYTETQRKRKDFDLWEEAGGDKSDQRIYQVNPYRFARTVFTMWVDPDKITSSAIGLDRDQKMENIKMLTLPFVAPFTDPEAIANDVIDEYGGDNPDRFKRKGGGGGVNEMLASIMGQGKEGAESPLDQLQPAKSPVGAAGLMPGVMQKM